MPRLFALALLLLVLAPGALAQNQATISGTVTDEGGEPLPGVSIVATRIEPPDSARFSAATDLDGAFRLSVPLGIYRVEAVAAGYTTEVREVAAALGMTRSVSIVLGVPPRPGATPTRYFDLDNDNYFLAGFGGAKSDRDPREYASQIRFRVSVRYKLVDWFECGRCGSGLSATYTQNSFWHLYDPSGPFFDNNYSPGVLVYHDFAEERQPSLRASQSGGAPRRDNRLPAIYAGVSHESNGREFPFSRGWNRVSAGASLGAVNQTPVSGSLTGWYAFGVEDTNADLVDYAGRGVAEVYVHPFMRSPEDPGWLTLHFRSRVLGRTLATNVEMNAMISPWRGPRAFTPAFTVQLFSGYAENLLTYNEHRTVARVGVAVTR